MTRSARLLLCLVAATAAAAPCAAEVRVSFPLEGYYRVGRYMPVRVVVRGERSWELTLSADGAVPTTLPLAGGGADVVAPLLVVRETFGPVTWKMSDGQTGRVDTGLTRLGENERLVGISGGRAEDVAGWLGDKMIVPVRLDSAEPTPGPATAWEMLDALVLGHERDSRLPVLASLTAGGTAVIIRRTPRPDRSWLPWRRVGGVWVMSRELAGPRGAVLNDAYDPAYGWKPGRPFATRRGLVLGAVVFSILLVALTLWRSRYAVVSIIALSAAATGATALISAQQSPVVHATAWVWVRQGESFQADEWEYVQSLAATYAKTPAAELKKPVFASAAHFERSGMTLVCDPSGKPWQFRFPLKAGSTMAFLTRQPPLRRLVGDPPPDASAKGSPLWSLVRQAYLPAGARAAGEVPPPARAGRLDRTEYWRGIVVEDSTP